MASFKSISQEMSNLNLSSDNYLVAVAIDFGTSYSGYAYSFLKKPHEIFANHQWESGKYQLASLKTPTCIVIRKDDHSEFYFGYDAEQEYADIQTNLETDQYFFFENFKMQLHHRKDISDTMQLYDIKGKPLPAVEVFSIAIKALKGHVMNHLQSQGSSIRLEDIKWVLTVPAIWTDRAKGFMRLAAVKAGIDTNRLSIALEPEAASVYCQHVYRKMNDLGIMSGPVIVKQGVPYLVVDLGGGTVDIVAHEKVVHDRVKELCHPTGSAHGGTAVDRAFKQMMENIVGATVMEKLKTEFTNNYFDLVRTFEMFKRNVWNRRRAKLNLQIPVGAFEQLCRQHLERPFAEVLRESRYADKVTLITDKLQMDKDLVKSFFLEAIQQIIEEINITLIEARPAAVNTFLLVGGFSASDMVRNAIQDAFPDKQVIIPDDPTLAVVKGAVLFGHRQDFVTSRFTRFAYGRRLVPKFDGTQHDLTKSVMIGNVQRCKNVFELFKKKNEFCPVGTRCNVRYHTVEERQSSVNVAVYVSDHDDTRYVDEEGCEKLVEFSINIPNPSTERRFVNVEFIFGGTELEIKANVEGTQDNIQKTIELI